MKRQDAIQAVPFLLFVCALLLFDTAGLVRMSLLASLLHECGHAVCIAAFQKPVCFHVDTRGVFIKMPPDLLIWQENVILLSGPVANLLAAFALIPVAYHYASYRGYFFALVQGSIGFFNLLPMRFLDGGRLLRNLLPAQDVRCGRWLFVLDAVSCVLVVAAFLFVLMQQKNKWLLLPVVIYNLLQIAVWKK